MTEGSKVLEDQLHLMDEKYLELRSKLDLTRDHLHKQIDKVKKECTELRKKYTVATGGGLLDKIQMPNNHIEMTDMDDHRKRRESRGSDGKNSKGHTNWSNQSFILDQSSVPIRNSPSQDKNDMLGGMGLRRPSVDMSEIEAIKQRMNRSKSVDFSPVALQSSNYNTTIQVTRSPAQANMQQTFMNEIKVGLPPQAAFQVTPINTSSNTLTNASNNNSGSNLRAPTPLSMRPTSALNSPQRRSNNNSPPSRPQSAAALGNNYSGMPKGMSDRILTHVVRKIQRKDGGTKKHGWTADRIHELLEG
ncbi:hypothetical protein EON65_16800 [archaeon]|nr:MAG: hypothetical protein EON65_16800 [archaeon]